MSSPEVTGLGLGQVIQMEHPQLAEERLARELCGLDLDESPAEEP